MMIHDAKSSINSLLTAGSLQNHTCHELINTLTRKFNLRSNNPSSKKRRARFLVARERTGFLDYRSRHVMATNVFASGPCNPAIMTEIKHTREAQWNAAGRF